MWIVLLLIIICVIEYHLFKSIYKDLSQKDKQAIYKKIQEMTLFPNKDLFK